MNPRLGLLKGNAQSRDILIGFSRISGTTLFHCVAHDKTNAFLLRVASTIDCDPVRESERCTQGAVRLILQDGTRLIFEQCS